MLLIFNYNKNNCNSICFSTNLFCSINILASGACSPHEKVSSFGHKSVLQNNEENTWLDTNSMQRSIQKMKNIILFIMLFTGIITFGMVDFFPLC